MARRKNSKKSGLGGFILVLLAGVTAAFGALMNFVHNNTVLVVMFFVTLLLVVIVCLIIKNKIKKQREELFTEILDYLALQG